MTRESASDRHGDFVWYELMTIDADAAQAFYGPLLGWEFADSGMEGADYRLFSSGGDRIGGLMALSPDMKAGGARSMWAGYIEVDDADAAADRIAALGGTVMLQPQDIPGVGRFAFAADPAGAPFYVMQGNGEPSHSFGRHGPRDGVCAWNELYTTDPTGAKAFYGELFGWTKDGEMDMGPMGKYEFLRTRDYMLGAIMPKPDEFPATMWVYYFRVPRIDPAVAYVRAKGGQVLLEPQEIPGGEFVIQGLDPQGALFALIGKREG